MNRRGWLECTDCAELRPRGPFCYCGCALFRIVDPEPATPSSEHRAKLDAELREKLDGTEPEIVPAELPCDPYTPTHEQHEALQRRLHDAELGRAVADSHANALKVKLYDAEREIERLRRELRGRTDGRR